MTVLVEIKPNDCGVYPEDHAERFELPCNPKGWQGMPIAEIVLLETRQGWLSCASYQLSGFAGGGYGLSPKWNSGFFPNRTAALADAMGYLKAHSEGDHRDAVAIRNWLARFDPVQPDLFSPQVGIPE